MKLSEINVNELSREQITKILFGEEQDNNQQADCIFVYGGKGIERVHKAVELYNQGRAKYILFTGGLGYGKRTHPLSLTMRDNALKMGIPEESILVEQRSNHVKEGAIASLFTLENKFGIHTIKNLLVVSIPWNYTRGLLSLKTYYPQWVNYIWCPANYQKHQSNNWWQDSESNYYVMKEITNLIQVVKEGQLMDLEVNF
jgi:uncharacterized SAM-binding protein YcdF (DUF218 family)